MGIILSFPICVGLLWVANIHCFWSDEVYKDRIWLHRTNTPEKLLEFANEYSGFECDIIVRGDSLLDVTHDEPVTYGISADQYFRLLQSNNRRLWFDIKNLKQGNAPFVLSFFESQCVAYQIDKKRLVIEGADPEALMLFRKAGFYTAFYVRLEENPDLHAITESGAVDALSFHARDYDRIAKLQTAQIDWLVWENHTKKEMLSVLPRGRQLLKDKRVKIILVKDKGHYHL